MPSYCDKHIYFSKEQVKRINEIINNKRGDFSPMVCKLVDMALENIEVIKRLDKLQNDIDSIGKKINITLSLEKQIYSDLKFDIDNMTDPNKSETLNMFFKKQKGTKLDD